MLFILIYISFQTILSNLNAIKYRQNCSLSYPINTKESLLKQMKLYSPNFLKSSQSIKWKNFIRTDLSIK